MKLKEKLTQLRKEKGWSQLELAERLNVSRQAVSRWENGLAIPSTDKLKQLSTLYGVSLDSLLSDSEEMKPPEKPEITATEAESDENAAIHIIRVKSRTRLKWVIAIACLAVLIVVVLLSMSHKDKGDNTYIMMSDIEPTETSPDISEGFSFTW
ncbi:MAG: helix-turn-helix domain-containing protein [Oscillospiraceae bacterium]|nr:helix-turn-helix domain-containing protein [Oscillospiraceae bacterium]